jgi:hypothetical protein
MSFRYGLTLPAVGGNKLTRFAEWARETVPDVAYKLPVQAPIKTETITVRLDCPNALARLRGAFPTTLP